MSALCHPRSSALAFDSVTTRIENGLLRVAFCLGGLEMFVLDDPVLERNTVRHAVEGHLRITLVST